MPTLSRLMGLGTPPEQAKSILGRPVSSLSAAGTTQGTATQVIHDISVFTTVAASSGVILPAQNAASMTALAGDEYKIVNGQGTNTLAVYPPVGGNFQGVAANTAVNVAASRMGIFVCLGGNVWAANLSA